MLIKFGQLFSSGVYRACKNMNIAGNLVRCRRLILSVTGE
jgi:hypothetical protein